MPRFKKSLADIRQEQKESDIRVLKIQMSDCIEKMGNIQLKMIECDNDTEEALLQRQLKRELEKRDNYNQRLARLVKKEEKRGRPKKGQGQKYQEQRTKFTAWLRPETLEYCRVLKSNHHIANISDFLDTLIEEHRIQERPGQRRAF